MPSAHATIVLDGSHGEGGGALLRTALAVSALTQQPVRIASVRGGTNYPGLDPEDVTIIEALAKCCAAETVGATFGSDSIDFHPTVRPRNLNGTVEIRRNEMRRGANACIVLGTLAPVLARAGAYSVLDAEGETFGNNALSYDYFAQVTVPVLRKAGLYLFPDLVSGGFGRESRGKMSLDVEPSAIQGVVWPERGRLLSVRAVVTTAVVAPAVGLRAVAHLRRLAQNAGLDIAIEHHEIDSNTPGFFVTAWATYERGAGGGTAMGSRGMRAEMLAQSAFEELCAWMATSATVDPFLADQILLPLAFAEGESTFSVSRLTPRFLTCAWVVKQFTPIHITIRGTENGPGTITIRR
jgi:RNA 3'-terminal phosphate cyclase (ATP)